ncbi:MULTISPECIES: hypothetical protein [unclassified Bradyrhizobium]|uniref:hypothetical protein n=1 Tax=unclassified Bradyrhizobium TaxID=2631580 RepID=UPI001FF750E4|nr:MULTISPECIES: hypothetical protein [unclassified Bradyrhizobium]MCK1711405.1 hypothetical protein [Bradyrhizobium sp. 143]MCK1731678.1 hypothetical protein [Bradyrhizobium sp. 142]
MLWNAHDLGITTRYEASAGAAETLGVTVLPFGVGEPNDFGDAFEAMECDKPDGLLMFADALTFLNRKRVFEFAAEHQLPAIYESSAFARDGGLMSYGPDESECTQRTSIPCSRRRQRVAPELNEAMKLWSENSP